MSETPISRLADAPDDIIRIFISGAARVNPKSASYGCVFAWRTIVKEIYGYLPGSTRQHGDLVGMREAFAGIREKSKDIHIYTDSSYADHMMMGRKKCEAHKDLLADINRLRRASTGQIIFTKIEEVKDPLCVSFVLRSTTLADIAIEQKAENTVSQTFQRLDWFNQYTSFGTGKGSSKVQHPLPFKDSPKSVTSTSSPKNLPETTASERFQAFFRPGQEKPRSNQACCLYVHLPSLNLTSSEEHLKLITLLASYLDEEGLSVKAGYVKPWKDIQQYKTKRIQTIKDFYQSAGFIFLNKGGIEGNVNYVVRCNPEIKDIMLIGNTDLAFSDVVTSNLRHTARFYLACDEPERVRVQGNFTEIIKINYLMSRI